MFRLGDYVAYTEDRFTYIKKGQVGRIIWVGANNVLTYKVKFGPNVFDEWWLEAKHIRLADTELLRALKKHL